MRPNEDDRRRALRHRLATKKERDEQTKAALVERIRALNAEGLGKTAIAAALGVKRQVVYQLAKHYCPSIPVERTPKPVHIAPDKPRPPTAEQRFATALGALCYEDDDRAAPPQGFAIPRSRPASLTANSSMAWTA